MPRPAELGLHPPSWYDPFSFFKFSVAVEQVLNRFVNELVSVNGVAGQPKMKVLAWNKKSSRWW